MHAACTCQARSFFPRAPPSVPWAPISPSCPNQLCLRHALYSQDAAHTIRRSFHTAKVDPKNYRRLQFLATFPKLRLDPRMLVDTLRDKVGPGMECVAKDMLVQYPHPDHSDAMMKAEVTGTCFSNKKRERLVSLQFVAGDKVLTNVPLSSLQKHNPTRKLISAGQHASADDLSRRLAKRLWMLDAQSTKAFAAGARATALVLTVPTDDGATRSCPSMAATAISSASAATCTVLDKKTGVLLTALHAAATEDTDILVYMLSEDSGRIEVHEAVRLRPVSGDEVDLMLLQVSTPANPIFSGALRLSPTRIKQGDRVVAMGFAEAEGSAHPTFLQLEGAVAAIDRGSGEMTLDMTSFRGLSGALVRNTDGYVVGMLQSKAAHTPGICYARDLTGGPGREWLARMLTLHVGCTLDDLAQDDTRTDPPVPCWPDGITRVTHYTPTNVPTVTRHVDRGALQRRVLVALLGAAQQQTQSVAVTCIRPRLTPSMPRPTQVEGFGGVGKTALASWAIRHEAVVKRFPCRFWVQLSQAPNLMQALQALYAEASRGGRMELRGKNEKCSEDTLMKRAQQKLRFALEGRRTLLVVDDVWDAGHLAKFRGIVDQRAGSRMLVTSRFSHLMTDSVQIMVDKLTDAEANWLLCTAQDNVDGAELEAVQEVRAFCRNHVLAISMVASMQQIYRWNWTELCSVLRNHKSMVKWAKPDYNTSYEGLIECIDMSVEALTAAQREKYEALVVLPEDVWMPLELLQEYWSLDKLRTAAMVAELHRRHLIEVAETPRRIKPHDLQRDYLLSKAEADPASLQQRHAALIGACRCEHVIVGVGWRVSDEQKQLRATLGPLAQYVSKNLMWHIQGAAKADIAVDLPWKTFVLCGVCRMGWGVVCVWFGRMGVCWCCLVSRSVSLDVCMRMLFVCVLKISF